MRRARPAGTATAKSAGIKHEVRHMGKSDDPRRYDDIIDLPHHVSETRPRMPMSDRAAQFSPFAAVVGHGAAVAETARLTERRVELDESRVAALDEQLRQLQTSIKARGSADAAITFFVSDEKKDGGAYISHIGKVTKIDALRRVAVMDGGKEIPLDDIVEIEELRDGD